MSEESLSRFLAATLAIVMTASQPCHADFAQAAVRQSGTTQTSISRYDIVAVGDVMLGRMVEKEIRIDGVEYKTIGQAHRYVLPI